MKRDEELKKKLLIEIEKKGPNIISNKIEIDGYDSGIISEHLQLLYDENLIDGHKGTGTDKFILAQMRLTNSGHDKLAELREAEYKELLKKLLIEIENNGPNIISNKIEIPGYDSSTISEHLQLLYDENLIDGHRGTGTDKFILANMKLTNSGHDKLAEIRKLEKEELENSKKHLEISESQTSNDLDIIKKLEQDIGENLVELNFYKQIMSDDSVKNGYVLEDNNVKGLRIQRMNISGISFVSELKNLTHLNLSDNNISDISPLKDKVKLKRIKLSGNQISDVSPLKSLVNLKALILSSNQISDVSPLKNLVNLIELILNSNQISDISSLKELKKLERLLLMGNNISKLPAAILDLHMPIKWADDNINGIFLKGNPLIEPPIDIVKKGKEAVMEYFKSLDTQKDLKAEPEKGKVGKDEVYNVESQLDNPADKDSLGRKIIAEDLAKTFRNIKEKIQSYKHSFLVNVQGAWGIGKTSFLGFLKKSLENSPDKKSPKWIIIEFNAWKHHRLGSPWWSIMNELYIQSKIKIKKINKAHLRKLRYKESVWRYGKIILFILLLIFLCLISRYFKTFLSDIPNTVKYLISIVTLLGLVLSSLKYFIKWPLLNSSNSIQSFIKQSKNPKDIIAEHFNELIKWIENPVIIFIDDLDRCPESYVVELLEEIQTLFGNTDVIYIVAADRRWICASYEKVYNSFKDFVNEPGRPIGHLFLEKIFQLSFTLTHDNDKLNQYWQNLVSGKNLNLADDVERRKGLDKLEQKIDKANSNEEVLQIINDAEKAKGGPDSEIRVKAINRLSDIDMKEKTEHGLEKFSHFLGANPRLMKRMINTFSILRTIAISSGFNVDYLNKQLALWIIIELRWPKLSDFLAKHPESVSKIGTDIKENEKDIPNELKELFKSEEVKTVIKGEGVSESLDEDSIKEFAKIRV